MKVIINGLEFTNNPVVNLEKIQRGDILESMSLNCTKEQSYLLYTQLNVGQAISFTVISSSQTIEVSGFTVDGIFYYAQEDSIRINGSKRQNIEAKMEDVEVVE